MKTDVEDREEAKYCSSALFRTNWSCRSFLETCSSQDMHTNIAHALVAEVKARELDRRIAWRLIDLTAI